MNEAYNIERENNMYTEQEKEAIENYIKNNGVTKCKPKKAKVIRFRPKKKETKAELFQQVMEKYSYMFN